VTGRVGRLFWTEVVLACITGFLAVLTTARPAWIEAIFGVDPDRDDGAVEWILVAGCAIATVALIALARREWRRFVSTTSN
jgi:hypothetical protein